MNELPNDESQWAIVELMGHKVVAGKVCKSEMMGGPLLRVDVPATSAYPEYTQFYGTAAIYALTFVSEEVARRTAEHQQVNPVSVYVPKLVTVEQWQAKEEWWTRRLETIKAHYEAQLGLPTGSDFPDDEDDPEMEPIEEDEVDYSDDDDVDAAKFPSPF
jgi:hypothetical protein